MGRRGRERLSEIKVGDRTMSTWRESVDVLIERFFPAARGIVEYREEERSEERQFE